MKKKSEFEAPYIGIETIDNTPIFYNRRGDYSVIIKCENPIIQYSADMDACLLYTSPSPRDRG